MDRSRRRGRRGRGRSAGSGGRGLLEGHPIIPMTGSGAGEVIIPRTFKPANSPGRRENRRDSAVLRRGPGGARRAVRSASWAGPDRPGSRGRRRDCEAPSGRARRRTGYRCRAPWNHSSRGVRAPRRGSARSRGTGPCGPVENLADLRGGGTGQADRADPARLDRLPHGPPAGDVLAVGLVEEQQVDVARAQALQGGVDVLAALGVGVAPREEPGVDEEVLARDRAVGDDPADGDLPGTFLRAGRA